MDRLCTKRRLNATNNTRENGKPVGSSSSTTSAPGYGLLSPASPARFLDTLQCFQSRYQIPTLLVRASEGLGSRVGIHLPLSSSHCHVDESASVTDSLLCPTLGRLLLLLGFDLWSLRLDLSGTRERSVNFTHDGGSIGSGFRRDSFQWMAKEITSSVSLKESYSCGQG